MKKLNLNFLVLFMLLLSFGTFAQVAPDLTCVEITEDDGTTGVVAVNAGALDELTASLDEEGAVYEIVECDFDFDFDFPFDSLNIDPNIDPVGGGWEFPTGDLVCVEITEDDGTTGVVAVNAGALDELTASLDEEGVTYAIVDCEEELELPGDLGFIDPFDFDWTGGEWNIPIAEFVCIEITADDGTTSVIGITANGLDEVTANLDEEGVTYAIVDCENDFDFPIDSLNFSDLIGEFDFDFEFPEFDLVCLELTNPDGSTDVIGVTANMLEGLQASLDAEGIQSQVVPCEEGIVPGDNSDEILAALRPTITKVGVFPNPSNGTAPITVNFESEVEDEVILSVINQVGKTVSNLNINTIKGSNTVELNPSDLGSGMYILSISNGKALNISKKLMILN